MKEIDFLPEWYKRGRKRQISYQTQYIVLIGVFVLMLAGGFAAGRAVSKSEARLTELRSDSKVRANVSKEFAGIKNQMSELRGKADVLEQIDSKIDVASVLAEMSFLIDKKIVLSKVTLKAERFSDSQGSKVVVGSAVRVASGDVVGRERLPLGPVRFSVRIDGIAADAADVAELVCKLEDSLYFCQVVPSFSSNSRTRGWTNVTGGEKNSSNSGTDFEVSEFEISCYLANYLQDEGCFAKNGTATEPKR